jgi:hypothetical protein
MMLWKSQNGRLAEVGGTPIYRVNPPNNLSTPTQTRLNPTNPDCQYFMSEMIRRNGKLQPGYVFSATG